MAAKKPDARVVARQKEDLLAQLHAVRVPSPTAAQTHETPLLEKQAPGARMPSLPSVADPMPAQRMDLGAFNEDAAETIARVARALQEGKAVQILDEPPTITLLREIAADPVHSANDRLVAIKMLHQKGCM
jgi:hypothetical protein